VSHLSPTAALGVDGWPAGNQLSGRTEDWDWYLLWWLLQSLRLTDERETEPAESEGKKKTEKLETRYDIPSARAKAGERSPVIFPCFQLISVNSPSLLPCPMMCIHYVYRVRSRSLSLRVSSMKTSSSHLMLVKNYVTLWPLFLPRGLELSFPNWSKVPSWALASWSQHSGLDCYTLRNKCPLHPGVGPLQL
jgi:hypothetical protein